MVWAIVRSLFTVHAQEHRCKFSFLLSWREHRLIWTPLWRAEKATENPTAHVHRGLGHHGPRNNPHRIIPARGMSILIFTTRACSIHPNDSWWHVILLLLLLKFTSGKNITKFEKLLYHSSCNALEWSTNQSHPIDICISCLSFLFSWRNS